MSRLAAIRLAAPLRWLMLDARHAQILALGAFLALGLLVFRFDIRPANALMILIGALGGQYLLCRALGAAFDWRSPLITALSLTLLLRLGAAHWALAAALLAVSSKFALRVGGRHIFNPANFGLCVITLLTPYAWVSPGQWGAAAQYTLLFGAAGLIVTKRAGRWDVSLAFLGAWAALIFGRALWLNDPIAVPLHNLQSGALLLFAFFMISDPMTTPRARGARLIFAGAVALTGYILTFALYESAGVIYALIICAPLTPLLNFVFPADAYVWRPVREKNPCEN